MTTDKELDRSRDIQRVNNAYHRVFGTDEGKVVLQNLRAYFRMGRPAFERSLNHAYDPLAAALRDGQREVLLFIEHKLAQPVHCRRRHRPTQNHRDPRLTVQV
jgi:PAS domain-containing protein